MAGARSDDRLQQYFDGELAGAEAEALRREIEADESLRAKLEGLAQLRTLLVAGAEAQGDEVDSESLWAGIESRLATAAEADDDPMLPRDEVDEAEPARPALGVIPGGKATEATKPRTNVVWIGLATTLAIAAAVLLVVLRPFDFGAGDDTDGGGPVADAPRPGSEVEEVDFGYSTGAIFSVEGQEGERYAVVWISDEKPAVEGGQERLQ